MFSQELKLCLFYQEDLEPGSPGGSDRGSVSTTFSNKPDMAVEQQILTRVAFVCNPPANKIPENPLVSMGNHIHIFKTNPGTSLAHCNLCPAHLFFINAITTMLVTLGSHHVRTTSWILFIPACTLLGLGHYEKVSTRGANPSQPASQPKSPRISPARKPPTHFHKQGAYKGSRICQRFLTCLQPHKIQIHTKPMLICIATSL